MRFSRPAGVSLLSFGTCAGLYTLASSTAHSLSRLRPCAHLRRHAALHGGAVLSAQEIPGILSDCARAASNAIDAGFHGVQIMRRTVTLSTNSCADSSNFRSDACGGSIANRIRLLVEISQAVADAVGADRTSYASRATAKRKE